MNTNFGRSSLVNEKFIELCDEFINKSLFENRPYLEDIKKEWSYFKILLNNKMLEKQQISDYFSILKEKILLQKSSNLTINYKVETPIINRPAAISCSDPLKRKPNEFSEFSTHKHFSEFKPNSDNHQNMNTFLNPFKHNDNISGEIFEFMKKNNDQINNLVYLNKTPFRKIDQMDLVDEITQKYH